MAAQAWAAIKTAINAMRNTLQESGTVTHEIGTNMLNNMHSIAETAEHANTRMEQIENTLNAMNLMVANDIKALHEKTAYLQGAIDSGSAKSGGSARRFGILESKAIQ